MKLLAFHGEQAIKDKYLARVRAHRAADQIIKGEYWRNGKGCAVGCTVHSSEHASYESELGIPRLLARLEDGIFEALPNGTAMEWPERFLAAIPVGADLSKVWPQFAIWLLGDETNGVIRFAKTQRTKDAINSVVEAYKRQVEGEEIKIEEWRKIRAAAAAADAYAADAYAAAAAAAAAADAYAADAYAAAAAAAADAYADAYAYQTQRTETRKLQADKLIELLQAAPVAQLATA